MYHVIALVGDNNCGKTTTLNMVYDNVMRKGGTSVISKQPLGHQRVRALYNDFSSVVSFMGRQIMFYTMGDYADTGDFMAEYYRKGFDMFVCALSTTRKRHFLDIRKYSNTKIPKTVATNASEQKRVNTKDAEHIYSLICEVLNRQI